MSDMNKPEETYIGRVCMSREKAIIAWKLEYLDGWERIAVAFKLNVHVQTIYRMYKHYNMPSPKSKKAREEAKKYAESLSLLQRRTPDRVRMPEKAFTEKK